MNRTLSRALAGVAATALVVVAAGQAVADNVQNSVGANGTTTLSLVGGQASTDIDYWIDQTNAGGNAGCDPADGTSATVTVSANAAGLTIDNPATAGVDNTMTFTGCGTASTGQHRTMRFIATAAGEWDISVTVADAGTSQYNANSAKFKLTVTAPTNTAPQVAVTGVTDGAPYELGAVPVAGCQVTDAEDGNSTKPATLSDISGPLAAQGIGSQTATCTHTDSGGLIATPASATYTIRDTTKPSLTVPAGQVIEANELGGAVATWSDPSASDLGGLATGSPSCDPVSGTKFALGTHTVTCSATDLSGNTESKSFTVEVTDTTKPTITGGAGNTVEATGPSTSVTYTAPTASDIHDGPIDASCLPASGSGFSVGTTTVTCTATDSSGNSSSVELLVTVTDTTAPAITVPSDITGIEATGPSGAAVTFSVSATDLVDGARDVTCDYDSGDTFPLGETLVSCTSEDTRGNSDTESFKVEVVDTTKPTLVLPADFSAEATKPAGADVTYVATASDTVDENVTADCIAPSGSTFALGPNTVNCTATDDSGNTAEGSFVITVVDTTKPTLSLPADIATGATSAAGAVVSFTATAADIVDGTVPVTCTPPSGSTFGPGTTTVNCSATDNAGNTASGSFKVTVTFGWNGFFAPVDNNGVINTIKGGQSVPMKWNIPDGSGGYVSSLSVVSSVRQVTVTCATSAPTDDIEAPTSGATSLRYDTTANQFIYNWQSPKGAGTCYKVTVNLTDGKSYSALFKTK